MNIVTKGDAALCSNAEQDTADVQGCTHEEADTRVLLHAAYAAKHEDISSAIICSSDTDVVIIAASSMEKTGLEKLWIKFRREKDMKRIPIHEIAAAMGPKATALPFFHAFIGCETVSFFHGKGKKSA